MKYGLIGEHLPHSFSKEIHAKIASYEYELHELSKDQLAGFMQKHDFSGINVTIPYKEAVIPFLSEVDETAKRIGAVNTVVNRNGKLFGYNTDAYGMRALILKTGLDFTDAEVLILGTGGTAHTAHAVAESLGAKTTITVGRTAKNGAVTYDEAYRSHADADFIINTTPCGMYPYPDGKEGMAGIPVELSKFTSLRGVIDAVFNPLRTNLVLEAAERGIPAGGGLYMLVAQAVAAAEIFTGTAYDAEIPDKVYREIRAEKENIVLTGMPGSGKTTVGQYLANELGRRFYDTDAEIVKKTGKEISALFAEIGNDGFRALEAEVIAEISGHVTGAVIATGGGAVLRDDNVRALKRTGRLYFLNRSLDKIEPTADRPLALDRAALEARFRERYERYLATCDIEIVTDENVYHTADSIKEDLYHEDSCHKRS
ncbi:MAG: AAA family ATPase [Clostridiales bacterium]|nr:AAA family ATPase [Clostridiales bacterium]